MTDPDEIPEFRQSLAPYLARIEQILQQAEGTDAILLSTSDGEVQLSEWLTARVRGAMQATGDEPPDELSLVVTDALGFRIKVAKDLRFEADSPAKTAQLIRLSSDIGAALAGAIQKEVNRLVQEVILDDANQLSEFHRVLLSDLDKLKARLHQLIPPDQAQEDGDESADKFRIDTGIFEDPELKEKQRKALEEKKRLVREKEQKKLKRAKIKRIAGLGSIAAVLLVVWILTVLVPGFRDRPIDQLTRDDFLEVATITTVTARPPSIFITVDLSAWVRSDDAQKIEIVRMVGVKLTPTPYTGAIIYTSDNRPVASWLRARGSRVFPPPDLTSGGET
ncbi:MAG: hypothetical protein GY906_17740 [bacterium]|nr:hypothetical protein [bacterium]